MMVHKLAAGKQDKRPKRKPTEVTVTSVDPDALAVAWQIAEGNAARLQVVSHDSIIVHNHPWRKRA